MKVYIGPYKNWIGPYQIANFVFGNPERVYDTADETWRHRYSEKLGDWLSVNKKGEETWLTKLCHWVDGKRKRKVYVKIDRYDVWSMDHTLAYIVVPMLKQLKETKHGAPLVDDEDVPEELKSTSAPPKNDEYDVDGNHFKRWEWVLDEMIWTFSQQLDEDADSKFYDHGEKVVGESLEDSVKRIKIDRKSLDAWQARKTNGFRLFGKYYEALWD